MAKQITEKGANGIKTIINAMAKGANADAPFGPPILVCGDAVVTTGHPSLFKEWKRWIAVRGIQYYQWRKGFKEYKSTHVRGYVGKLTLKYAVRAHQSGLLDVEAERRGITIDELYTELCMHDDWCFSMTTPHGRWDRWADIYRDEDWRIQRPEFCDFAEEAERDAFEQSMWRWFGVDYEEEQLLDILVNERLRVPRNKFMRILDGGSDRTVCSGTLAAGYEVTRKFVGEAWRRLMDGLDCERFAPAHYVCLPRGARYRMEFRTYRRRK